MTLPSPNSLSLSSILTILHPSPTHSLPSPLFFLSCTPDEQLAVARRHEDWHRQQFGFSAANTSFRQAHIEDLRQAGVEDR